MISSGRWALPSLVQQPGSPHWYHRFARAVNDAVADSSDCDLKLSLKHLLSRRTQTSLEESLD